MKRKSFGDLVAIACGCAIVSAIIGFLLNCVIFPIAYYMTHDCGKWLCGHNYPITWGSYAIVTGIVFLLLFVISYMSENQSGARINHSRIYYRQSEDDLETDYYDSDMEGAPGYNGFE